MRNSLLILLFALLLISCREEKEIITVTGRLVSNCQNDGLENQFVQFISKKQGGTEKLYYEGELFTNQNGEFNYSFESVDLLQRLILKVNGVNVYETNIQESVDFGSSILIDSLTSNILILPDSAYSAEDSLIISIRRTRDTLYGPFSSKQLSSVRFKANSFPVFLRQGESIRTLFEWEFKKKNNLGFPSYTRREYINTFPCGANDTLEVRF
jgi:hypothetical protein